MEYDIFISYSRKDSAIVSRMYEALSKAGYNCFIDLEGISGGADFPEILASSILSSKLFLFVASENAYASEYTIKEVTYAVTKKTSRFIFPIIIDKSPLPSSLEFLLSNINWRTLSPTYRIEKEFITDIQKKLQDKYVGETQVQKKQRAEKKMIWALSAVLIIFVSLAGVFAWKESISHFEKDKIETNKRLCRQDLRLADKWIARFDSLDLAVGASSAYILEKDYLDSASVCLSRVHGILSSYSESFLLDSENGFSEIKSIHEKTESLVESRMTRLHQSLCREVDLAINLYRLTEYQEDLSAALSAIDRVLQVFPNDESTLRKKQSLSVK